MQLCLLRRDRYIKSNMLGDFIKYILGRTSHARIMEEYGAPFAEGDIIGCFLNLDTSRPEDNEIRFFKNGVDQGQAYFGKEIPLGVYFPAVSLYGGVSR